MKKAICFLIVCFFCCFQTIAAMAQTTVAVNFSGLPYTVTSADLAKLSVVDPQGTTLRVQGETLLVTLPESASHITLQGTLVNSKGQAIRKVSFTSKALPVGQNKVVNFLQDFNVPPKKATPGNSSCHKCDDCDFWAWCGFLKCCNEGLATSMYGTWICYTKSC